MRLREEDIVLFWFRILRVGGSVALRKGSNVVLDIYERWIQSRIQ